MQYIHIIKVNIKNKQLSIPSIKITQNDSSEYLKFVFNTEIEENSIIKLKVYLPNRTKYIYLLQASKNEEDDSYFALWHIPTTVLNYSGQAKCELKIIETEESTTIGRFSFIIQDELFEDEIIDTFAADTQKCR